MKTVAVHLHLYYRNQADEMLRFLRNLRGIAFDLFITMVENDPNLIAKIQRVWPTAHVYVVPNRGYDVGPFIDFLHRINLNNYRYILKLHTKGTKSQNTTILNGYVLTNALWREIMLNTLIGSPARVRQNINLLETQPDIGEIASAYCITEEPRTWRKMLPQINQVLTKMGLEPVKQVRFAAGSMFWIRADLCRPLLAFTLHDFEPTNGQIKDGTLAHVMERVFGLIVTGQGKRIAGIWDKTYQRRLMWAKIRHFFFQKKRTSKGYTLIKIVKIPVYHTRFKNFFFQKKTTKNGGMIIKIAKIPVYHTRGCA